MNFAAKISIDEQLSILNKCISKSIDLCAELNRLGLSYDDLRYRNNPPITPNPAKFLIPDDVASNNHGVPIVSFFSGAGGLDIGFEYAGFKHLASIEINSIFCQTIRLNRPNWFVVGPPDYSGDVKNRDEIFTILKVMLGIPTPFEGIFTGGPPCQPFSIAANQRFSKEGDNFKRVGFSHSEFGNLLFDFVWYIQQFKPKAFLLENVTGLRDIDGGKQLSEAISVLEETGYTISEPVVMNAASYSIPQNRNRLFVFGHRTANQFVFPEANLNIVPCYKAFEHPVNNLENHITRQHKAESIIRYMELNYGRRDKLGRVDRLNPDLPSKTVISGGTKGGGRSHLHPIYPRTLTVRESARLQTFPDNFVFSGSPARQFTQVGNAVPPLLALQLANSIYYQIYAGSLVQSKEKSRSKSSHSTV
ncbi:DNA cytosine methyltransferase [Nodularia spumigena CS-584]|jgi:DNA (cytosine-5)-methyltransferase 1|uniref:DNA (cytosine-5-)-methyltransferase n=1 Tax=Nodularia spumigena UHCC 0039 TaxID=1914872 RepID=A0A2S0QAI6_NODSP|nr:DNA cytosine methyltransferase [Nodularia spumigena]AHJ30403.1 DNA-cytosine methyltransferase [Nodularia spumigena CCY9414]AVZ31381.1 modification methylase AplI [Nodularia spumigena UHCC 0039]EAW46982.1 DNA-cytosine methyltransferase family protein [Nodularia spumigena CCY9414]MDB9383443.1 DNA cytosine methyltransferase [Nodularia spumigena CS-584]